MKKAARAAAPVKTTRMQAKKLRTRAALLKAAHELMSKQGVDETTILEITDRADVGFGTFYNYFATKDDIAAGVLDCVIVTLGRRNDLATKAAGVADARMVIANSVRAVAREMMRDQMWRWWLKRPDLLIDRMREGFRPFAMRDIDRSWRAGADLVADPQSLWSMLVWLLGGRVIDIADGHHNPDDDRDLTEAVLRLLGMGAKKARSLTIGPPPPLPPAEIDFSVRLEDVRAPDLDAA